MKNKIKKDNAKIYKHHVVKKYRLSSVAFNWKFKKLLKKVKKKHLAASEAATNRKNHWIPFT